MNMMFRVFVLLLVFTLPQIGRAEDPGPGVELAFGFVDKANEVILFPLIALLTAAALVYFFWGAFQFIANADNEQARSTGRQHMLFGVIGLLIMLSAYTLLQIAAGTFSDIGGEDTGIGIPARPE